MTALIAINTLIIGLLLGFYAKELLTKVQFLYDLWQEKTDRHEAGVVTPRAQRITRSAPIDLSSETGGVMRPRPDTAAIHNMKAREEAIRRRTP